MLYSCPGNFYPRSPCGERHLRVVDGSKSSIISIHALLAESDPMCFLAKTKIPPFLSTLSLRRATGANGCITAWNPISIHALLAESDRWPAPSEMATSDFYPRSPCGERREYWVGGYGTANNFYPRSPCGERPPSAEM